MKHEKANIVYELGKKWIKKSALRNLDRTAYIFVQELQDMGEDEKADKLYSIYKEA